MGLQMLHVKQVDLDLYAFPYKGNQKYLVLVVLIWSTLHIEYLYSLFKLSDELGHNVFWIQLSCVSVDCSFLIESYL